MKLNRLAGLHLIILLMLFALPSLALGQGSYTYTINRTAVPGPGVYRGILELYGEDLGVGPLREPQDLYISKDNTVFISDSGNNRIIVADQDFNVLRVIAEFDNDGAADKFSSPRGIFLSEEGHLYVADYGSRRIVILDESDTVIRTIENPKDQELIPADFNFRPRKVMVDRAGRVYVIAEGVLEGLMEFDEEGVFAGYIGAPRVTPNPLDYLWRQIMTEAQRERSIIFVPTEYSSFDIDERGFIYATVSSGGTSRGGVIRRLNPSGEDVLRREGFGPPMGDVAFVLAGELRNATILGNSSLQDVSVRANGIYSVTDLTRGRVFTYDDYGNLLYAFGAPVFERNAFRAPTAIAYLGDRMVVIDRRLNMISVLEPTSYAQSIYKAIDLYQSGDYDGSADVWRDVLKQNPNLDIAYSGIGRALIRQADYQSAMDMYRLGNDREGYSQALGLYRRDWINENFAVMMTIFVVVVLAYQVFKAFNRRMRQRDERSYAGLGYRTSENKFGAYLQRLQYAFRVIFRPSDGFWDLKHEQRGSVGSATTILFLMVLTFVFSRQYTGFVFNYTVQKDLNIYMEITSILLPFMLWCVVNLALTSIMEGKGSFRDIYIASAYALVPVVLIYLPLILISRVITMDEGAFYYIFQTIGVLWAGFLLMVGMGVTHQYGPGKTVFTGVLTIAGIGIVIFLALLFFNVLAQLYGFIDTILTEITFRL